MHWLVFMAGAIIIRAFYSVAAKSATNNVDIHPTNFSTLFLGIAGLVGFAATAPFGLPDLSILADEWVLILFVCLTMVFGNVIFFYGQRSIDTGTIQVALSSKLVWTALLAMPILGTRYSSLQVIGMVLLASAIYLISIGVKHKAEIKGILLIGLSAVSFGLNSVLLAKLSDVSSLSLFLLITYLGTALLGVVLGWKHLARDIDYLREKPEKLLDMLYASLTSLGYFIVLYITFNEAGEDRGLVSVLTNAQVVTSVLLAAFLLHERANMRRKIAAGAIVLIAACLISGI